jgi:hypothetical protein
MEMFRRIEYTESRQMHTKRLQVLEQKSCPSETLAEKEHAGIRQRGTPPKLRSTLETVITRKSYRASPPERGDEPASVAQRAEDDRGAWYRPPRQFLTRNRRLRCHSHDPQGDRDP